MNVLDIFIILLCITALLQGVVAGFVRQICVAGGLFVGLLLGSSIQGRLAFSEDPTTRTLIAMTIITVCASLLAWAGRELGEYLKKHIERFNILKRAPAYLDGIFGGVVGGSALLVAVWLCASVINYIPTRSVQRQLRNSAIITHLNRTFPSAPNLIASLQKLIDPNAFPDVFTGFEPRIDTTTQLPSIGELDGTVQQSRASVVRIEGSGCGGVSEGSGFVASHNTVITNAHVIAGTRRIHVSDANGQHAAIATWFDPALDLAILRTNNLAGEPLPLATDLVKSNTPGAVLGYPGGGDLVPRPATIIDVFNAIGRDIYDQGATERQVYSVKSDIVPGNSGGPLIDMRGSVVGVVFAQSTTYDGVGYALTSSSIATIFDTAKQRNTAISTGNCTQ